MVREEERGDVHAWEEEKGIERDGDLTDVWSMRASDEDGASRTRTVAARARETTGHYRRRDKTGTRERGIRSVGRRRRYRRSPHIHMRARPPTLAQADAHWAVRLAHYRLPDSHHELLEKSIEYKKSPWCARRAEPSPLLPRPSSFPSCSLSSSFSLLPFPSLVLSVSFQLRSASLSPTAPFPLLSRRISRARSTRGICVRRCSAIKRGRARVYTLAIDGDRRHACTHDGQGRR